MHYDALIRIWMHGHMICSLLMQRDILLKMCITCYSAWIRNHIHSILLGPKAGFIMGYDCKTRIKWQKWSVMIVQLIIHSVHMRTVMHNRNVCVLWLWELTGSRSHKFARRLFTIIPISFCARPPKPVPVLSTQI